MLRRNLGEGYNPLFFLSSLGAGGLAVSFFLYPMFLVDHHGVPLVTFEHIRPILTGPVSVGSVLLGVTLLLVLFFAVLHFRLLAWNLREYCRFRRTRAFETLRNDNDEIGLMAIPLTLAMTINVLFVLGALFVPGLWSVVEWLFPLALAGFAAVGVYALKILTTYFARTLTHGNVDFSANNSLSPMIAIFALAMIAVGFAAPAMMSQTLVTMMTGMLLSLFFFTSAALLAVIKLVHGFQAMMIKGIRESASPSLWILIPILTLMGITWVRLSYGMHHTLGQPMDHTDILVFGAGIISAQILFGLIGYAVMQRLGYFRDYVRGPKGDAGTFTLICPGVAFFVFGLFFIHLGLIASGVVDAGSWVHYALMAPFVLVQAKTVQVMLHLKRHVMQAPPAAAAAAAR
ncbi:MAG: TsoY family (seleno)protein [Ectothiorhodospira sp.]